MHHIKSSIYYEKINLLIIPGRKRLKLSSMVELQTTVQSRKRVNTLSFKIIFNGIFAAYNAVIAK